MPHYDYFYDKSDCKYGQSESGNERQANRKNYWYESNYHGYLQQQKTQKYDSLFLALYSVILCVRSSRFKENNNNNFHRYVCIYQFPRYANVLLNCWIDSVLLLNTKTHIPSDHENAIKWKIHLTKKRIKNNTNHTHTHNLHVERSSYVTFCLNSWLFIMQPRTDILIMILRQSYILLSRFLHYVSSDGFLLTTVRH